MTQRAFRSLARLQGSASTSRTLNLHATWMRFGGLEEYKAEPLFQSPLLNRSIILKHRLRRNELDVFNTSRTAGTKVILPLDPSNLRAGAQYFFIDQRGYGPLVRGLLGPSSQYHSRDMRLLALLGELPSFDPFLMREKLKRSGFSAGACYFQVSDADMRRMFSFVQEELQPLVGVSFDQEIDFVAHTAVLAAKILSNSVDGAMEPLRATLKLGHAEFQEGIFCWKGFLYYKWNLLEFMPQIRAVLGEVGRLKPRGLVDSDAKASLARSRKLIREAVHSSLETVRNTLQVYQDAFDNMARHGRPAHFREFLLEAPSLFSDLGERLGAINHVVSFWRYRFPHGEPNGVMVDELLDIFADFESSLNYLGGDSGRFTDFHDPLDAIEAA